MWPCVVTHRLRLKFQSPVLEGRGGGAVGPESTLTRWIVGDCPRGGPGNRWSWMESPSSESWRGC